MEDRRCHAVFDWSGSVSRPSPLTIVTALVSTSKPASSRDTSLATIRSICLASRLAAARALTSSVSAAKPTSSGPRPLARRRAPRSAENVRSLPQHQRQRLVALGDFCPARCCRRVVGDGGRHDHHVRASACCSTAPCISARRERESTRAPAAARSSSGRRSASPRRRGAPLRRRARTPCGRSIGCRCSAPDRSPRRWDRP